MVHNENDQTSELTNKELDMIQPSLLVVIQCPYIQKLLMTECDATEEHFPTQTPESSNGPFTEPASPSSVTVTESEVDFCSSATESVDELDPPKHKSAANGNACVLSQCRDNGRMGPTATVGAVTMASENPDLSAFALCNETLQNGFPKDSSTGKNVDVDKVFLQPKKALSEPTVSSDVDSQRQILSGCKSPVDSQRQIPSGCKSPVELYMAAAPQFLKKDAQDVSSFTFKSESRFSPSQLERLRLKADLGNVSALFPTFRCVRSRSGRSRRKLFNHRQVLTAGDELGDSSSPTPSSFVSSDSESLSSCNLRSDLEDSADDDSIPLRSPKALFQKPLAHPRSSSCKKRKLFNGSELLCPAAEKSVSPQRESLLNTTMSPASDRASGSLHQVDEHFQKTCATVESSSPKVGEEIPSSITVPVGKLYSEILTLCLKKKSLKSRERLEST